MQQHLQSTNASSTEKSGQVLQSNIRGAWRGSSSVGSSGLFGFFGLSGSENEISEINQIDQINQLACL
jgi:hypothetical protein